MSDQLILSHEFTFEIKSKKAICNFDYLFQVTEAIKDYMPQEHNNHPLIFLYYIIALSDIKELGNQRGMKIYKSESCGVLHFKIKNIMPILPCNESIVFNVGLGDEEVMVSFSLTLKRSNRTPKSMCNELRSLIEPKKKFRSCQMSSDEMKRLFKAYSLWAREEHLTAVIIKVQPSGSSREKGKEKNNKYESASFLN